MKTDYQHLFRTLKNTGKGPCVSILLPLTDKLPESRSNKARFREAIKSAIEELEQLSDDLAQSVIKRLKALAEEKHEFLHSKGIGLFVSPEVEELVEFPFPVSEKVMVDQNFALRDLIYAINQQIEYWLIIIGADEIRPLKGKGKDLTPVQDADFPFKYVEEYEREQTPNRFGEGMEDSIVKEKRQGHFYKEAAGKLKKYFSGENLPLILAGLDENIGLFEKYTNINKVILRLPGNHQKFSEKDLQEAVWKQLEYYLQHQREKSIEELEEAPTVFTDLRDIILAATQGNGKVLLVERDFRKSIDIKDELLSISLNGKIKQFDRHIPDVVDDIIELMMEINAEVVFVDNDRLAKYGPMALIPRY